MKRCTVTATAPDGRRTSCEVEAASRNRAVFAYNYRAVSDATLIRPLPDNGIVFEVTPEGGEALRCTWTEVCAWGNRESARVHARQSSGRALEMRTQPAALKFRNASGEHASKRENLPAQRAIFRLFIARHVCADLPFGQ